MPAPVTIALLGNPQITIHDQPIHIKRRKALALLAYLATQNAPVNRETLATLLSPDHSEARARAELRRALATLKEAGLQPWLTVDRYHISLDAAVWVDVIAFRDGIKNPSLASLPQTVTLYRDYFLAGFSLAGSVLFDEWQTLEKHTLQQQYLSALQHLVEGLSAQDAIPYLQKWLQQDELNEALQQRAMRVFVQAGQRSAALKQYEWYAAYLQKEMGVDPLPETTELYQDILHSRFAEPSPPQANAIQGNLPMLPPLVIGRAEAVAEIKRRLGIGMAGDELPPVVVQGWPGIGKTTMASVIAHDAEVHQHFSDGVLWTSPGEAPNLLVELKRWGQALGLPNVEQFDDERQIASQIRPLLQDRRMLLIVDDVWSAQHFLAFQVGGKQCRVLTTTRLNDVAQQIATTPDAIYKLPILAERDALHLLQTLAPDAVDSNPQAVRALIRDLEGLPLALQVAGRLLREEMRMGWGIDELLHELRAGAALLQQTAPPDRAELLNSTPPTVAALLSRSTDLLSEDNRLRFALLGVFAPRPATFDLDALRAVWEVDDPRPTTRKLVSRGLMEPIGEGVFQIHALLIAHAKSMFTTG